MARKKFTGTDIVFAKLSGAEHVEIEGGIGAFRSILTGAGKANGNRGDLSILEDKAFKNSLRLEMRDRVKTILEEGGGAVKRTDIQAWAKHDFADLVTSIRAVAYLTNAVAWGLSDLMRKRLIEKLDEDGRPMRDEDGKVINKPAAAYVLCG